MVRIQSFSIIVYSKIFFNVIYKKKLKKIPIKYFLTIKHSIIYFIKYIFLLKYFYFFVYESFLYSSRYLIILNFKRKNFFPAIKTIHNLDLLYTSLGIFFFFIKKKKNILKSKIIYLFLINFFRKILIFLYFKIFYIQIYFIPKFFLDILNTLLDPIQKFYFNPFKSNIYINEIDWNPQFFFHSIFFKYSINSKFKKIKKKGRLKRKISNKIILFNKIND